MSDLMKVMRDIMQGDLTDEEHAKKFYTHYFDQCMETLINRR